MDEVMAECLVEKGAVKKLNDIFELFSSSSINKSG